MALKRGDDDERAARIDMLLEELRLNRKDLHELTTQARQRAQNSKRLARVAITKARRRRARVVPKKKR